MNLSDATGWFKTIAQRILNSQLLQNRWLRLGIQAIILIMCLVYLAANWRNVHVAQLVFRWEYLLLAMLISAVAVFWGAIGWWLTLLAFDQSFDWFAASKIHIYANLAKYLPGFAWQLLGKGYLARNSGIPQRVIPIAMLIELVQLYMAGLWIAAVTVPNNLVERWFGDYSGWYIVWVLRIVFTLLMVGFPFAIVRIARLKRTWIPDIKVNLVCLLAATTAMLIGWFVLGLSYWMVGAALQTFSIQQMGLFTFTLAISFLIGLAIVIVPGSLGIRESIMVFLLGPVVGPSLAVIIATLSRFILILSELFSALIIWLVQRIRH